MEVESRTVDLVSPARDRCAPFGSKNENSTGELTWGNARVPERKTQAGRRNLAVCEQLSRLSAGSGLRRATCLRLLPPGSGFVREESGQDLRYRRRSGDKRVVVRFAHFAAEERICLRGVISREQFLVSVPGQREARAQ